MWLESEPVRALAKILSPPEACRDGLRTGGAAYCQKWAGRLANQGWSAADVGRCMLVQSALATIPLLSSQRLTERVQRLLLEDFLKYTQPPARWLDMFDPATVRFSEMMKLVLFRRFPAGQLHWEPMNFPRRYLIDAGLQGGLRLARCLLQLGGRGPMWELHLNDRRPNAFLLTEKAACKSYHRMAGCLELQPEVRAITVGSWMYSRELAQVSPHLAWLRRHFESCGATVADLGLAPPDSGFLTGDPTRKALYESGVFHPRIGVAIWPRSAAIEWAAHHPEFAD